MARNQGGYSITEMGPALFLLLIMGIFPVLDLIFAGSAYTACVLLNNLQMREAARIQASQADMAMTQIAHDWQLTGIGQFAGVLGEPQTQVSYVVVPIASSTGRATETYVNVSTSVTVRPFLTIPFFNGVPALGSPVSYNINGRRLMESAILANM
jgi:nitrate reductase NapE component